MIALQSVVRRAAVRQANRADAIADCLPEPGAGRSAGQHVLEVDVDRHFADRGLTALVRGSQHTLRA